jgi:hypothetical protein
MKRGIAVALALFALSAGVRSAWAQGAPQCAAFQGLSTEAQKRGDVVSAALKNKTDRKELCGVITSFVGAEAKVVKFLEDNKTWCGVPDQVVAASKANHAKSVHFQTVVCSAADAPKPKVPTLSDALKTIPADSATNTKTGRGTFDTLTGNPLAK